MIEAGPNGGALQQSLQSSRFRIGDAVLRRIRERNAASPLPVRR
jgi:hypothetical protein